MPTETEYTLTELATLAGVTPRTVRYYISLGLLPSPGQVGPGTRYGDGILQRVRLIRRLQSEHLPLGEIRSRIEGLDDEAVAVALSEPPVRATGSALDYIRALRSGGTTRRLGEPGLVDPSAPAPDAPMLPGPAIPVPPPPGKPGPLSKSAWAPRSAVSEPPVATAARSQWERVSLGPDVELHIRRPLGRLENRRVERLIQIARELLEEDTP